MVSVIQGCQREVIKKRGTTFCGKLDGELPLPVKSFKDPPILSEIISSDLAESQESIFRCQKSDFPPFGWKLVSLVMQVMLTPAYHLVDILPSGCRTPTPTPALAVRWLPHALPPRPPPTNPGYAGADPGGPGKHVMCPLDPQRWVLCRPPPTTQGCIA